MNQRNLLWIVLGVYLVLGVWYSFASPAFETPDEIYHYAFARHLAQGNWLPEQSEVSTGPWEQEGSQAPLYYMLTGLLTSSIDQSDFDAISVFNPRSNMGDPLYAGNKNRMLYSSAPRPLEGANLALHVGRWFGVALGAITVWLIYLSGTLAFGTSSLLPLIAALLVAVTPQYLFISASFSNDIMVIAASAAALYWLARIVVNSHRRSIRYWEWGVLGILLGVAALSKLQGLGLCVIAAGVGTAVAWQRSSWRTFFAAALGSAVSVLLIAGWWYWRNQSLYGDWSGVSHLTAINGLRQEPLDFGDFWLEFRGLRYSFWGLFGWFNILLPPWFYTAMDLLSVVAVIGAIGASVAALRRSGPELLRRPGIQVKILYLGWIALSASLLLYWMLRATGSQGRLVFPAIGAIAIWFVLGIDFWARRIQRPWRGLALAITPVLLLSMSLYGAAVAIPTAYAVPPTVSIIPAGATSVHITYGDDELIELLAVETPSQRYRAGDAVPVTLYLTAPAPLNRDYELFIQLLDRNGEVLGNVTSHPGWGSNPTSLWQPGVIYADNYQVPIIGPIDSRSPILARLYAGFIDPDTQPDLNYPVTARDESGSEITPIVAEIPISPGQSPSVADLDLAPTQIVFGDGLEVSGVGMPSEIVAGNVFTTTLLWTAQTMPATDYTAFLHLLDDDGEFVAGSDQAPSPSFPTSYWIEGDHVVSQIPMDTEAVTPGEYELWLGLYESASGGESRLTVTQDGGHEVQNEMVLVGAISVK